VTAQKAASQEGLSSMELVNNNAVSFTRCVVVDYIYVDRRLHKRPKFLNS
jgi:hypothetical protein